MDYFQAIECYKGFKIYPYMTQKSFYYEDSRERVFGKTTEELKKAINERIKDGFYLLCPGMEPGEIEERIRKIKKEEGT